MKRWEVNYSENVIVVENSAFGERLFVNDDLQDERNGLIGNRVRLWGQLKTGEQIKVSLGGTFKIQCRIFVDNKLVLSN